MSRRAHASGHASHGGRKRAAPSLEPPGPPELTANDEVVLEMMAKRLGSLGATLKRVRSERDDAVALARNKHDMTGATGALARSHGLGELLGETRGSVRKVLRLTHPDKVTSSGVDALAVTRELTGILERMDQRLQELDRLVQTRRERAGAPVAEANRAAAGYGG